MNNDLQKNYDTIDLFKYIGSIMIFFMHGFAFKDISADLTFGWELLTRWAVPFFFISSAFFLFLGGKDDLKHACGKYVKRILLLYCAWFIINIPSVFSLRLSGKDLLSIKTWILFLKDSVLSDTFLGAWFFASCIFSCIFVMYFCRNLSTKLVLLLTGILQLVCILSSVWGGIVPAGSGAKWILSFLDFPLNWACGCFYFAIGRFFAERKDKIAGFTTGKSVLLLIASCILYAAEVWTAKRTGYYHSSDQSLFVVLFGVSAFLLAVNSTLSLKGKAKGLRKASTVIFCAQSNLFLIKDLLVRFFNGSVPDFKYANTVSFCIALILMALVVLIVFKLQSKKIKFSAYLT